ncbi:hypothetical protein, partial [Mesorhizobium sp. M2C.T.Ca.TU.002.02.1.1]|uniref:hypothetical protein n=1 Tax=Mesorhizobium sp. M2C.T.Ca.TU.002.02.1.1 TaxID=2496788 RepID=UPI0019D05B9F
LLLTWAPRREHSAPRFLTAVAATNISELRHSFDVPAEIKEGIKILLPQSTPDFDVICNGIYISSAWRSDLRQNQKQRADRCYHCYLLNSYTSCSPIAEFISQ